MTVAVSASCDIGIGGPSPMKIGAGVSEPRGILSVFGDPDKIEL